MAFSLRQHDGEIVPRVEWESQTVALSADAELARTKKRKGPAAIQRKEAIVYLRQALAGGPRLVKEVEAEAMELHAISRRTLVRARKALRINAFHLHADEPYWMELPAAKESRVDDEKLLGTPGTPPENTQNHEAFCEKGGVPRGTPPSAIGTAPEPNAERGMTSASSVEPRNAEAIASTKSAPSTRPEQASSLGQAQVLAGVLHEARHGTSASRGGPP
jgi:hypothetical protein